jgi:glycogen operon protein
MIRLSSPPAIPSKGTIMLTAGDEAGRSQQGNNNAYCQDNDITWLNWHTMAPGLVEHTAFLSGLRKRFAVFSDQSFFTGQNADVTWLSPSGETMTTGEWEYPHGTPLAMVVSTQDATTGQRCRLAVLFNRTRAVVPFTLTGEGWKPLGTDFGMPAHVPARSVVFYIQP